MCGVFAFFVVDKWFPKNHFIAYRFRKNEVADKLNTVYVDEVTR